MLRQADRATSIAGGANGSLGNGGLLRGQGNTPSLGGARAPVDFTFTLRLRSALPVRQALVRLKQIDAHYDRLSEKERAALDLKLKGLLDCPACADNYVLTLSSRSREDPGADAVYTLFAGAKVEDIKRYITIANELGQQRVLVHFVPPRAPGDEATFFFPRLDEKGVPLFTADSKELVFNVSKNEVNSITNFRVDISKLVTNGKVEF